MSEKIRDILLQHKGKANAITSKCISEIMGFPMEDTQYVSRKEIWNTAKKYKLPLLSCNKGYFIAQKDEEIEEFNNNYEKRISGMLKTKEMVNKYYKEYKKNDI